MDTNQTRQWPSDAEFDQLISDVHAKLRKAVQLEARPWWRKLSRLTTATVIVVSAGGVAGGAYAATQLLAPSPPQVFTGNTVVKLDAPAPGDKWLNIQIAYSCRPGEHFTLKNGAQTIFKEDCNATYYSADRSMSDSQQDSDPDPESAQSAGSREAERGIAKSLPIGDVRGNTLTMTSTLTRDYRIAAEFGPTATMKQLVLPARRGDGSIDWATPDYTVNEYGLTVGVPKINTPEDQWPDLYPVTFHGRQGYFLGKDMNPAIPANPAAARKYDEEQRREGLIDDKGNMYTKVYAADGKTVLGKMKTGTFSSK